MATVSGHLSVDELEQRYVACRDATAARHFQAIWLLARGHTVSQVAATTAFGERWIEQLLARYNAEGPEALGDSMLRTERLNGGSQNAIPAKTLAMSRSTTVGERASPHIRRCLPSSQMSPSRVTAVFGGAGMLSSEFARSAEKR